MFSHRRTTTSHGGMNDSSYDSNKNDKIPKNGFSTTKTGNRFTEACLKCLNTWETCCISLRVDGSAPGDHAGPQGFLPRAGCVTPPSCRAWWRPALQSPRPSLGRGDGGRAAVLTAGVPPGNHLAHVCSDPITPRRVSCKGPRKCGGHLQLRGRELLSLEEEGEIDNGEHKLPQIVCMFNAILPPMQAKNLASY